jgi:hypothetical protein
MESIFRHNYHLSKTDSNPFSGDFHTLIAYGFRLANSNFKIITVNKEVISPHSTRSRQKGK